MTKVYRMHYIMRVYYCKKCDVHLEIPDGCKMHKCATCGIHVKKLKLESVKEHKVHKEVTDVCLET